MSPFSISVPVSNFQVPCIGTMLVASDLFCVFSLQEIMQKKNKTVVVDFSIVQFNSKKGDNVRGFVQLGN